VVDIIDTTTHGPTFDPAWRFTDAAGHEHTADRPLMVERLDHPAEPAFYFDVDGEEWNADSHLE
jgi:hypothetical protein